MGNKRKPLLARAAARTRAGFAVVVLERVLGFSVRIRAAVIRIRQHAIQHAIGRASPCDLTRDRSGGQLQTVLQKPRERLPHRPELAKFPEHQLDGFLNPAIGILLKMGRIGFEIPDRGGHPELAALRLRASRFHGALP